MAEWTEERTAREAERNLARLSHPQRRMILSGLIGERALLLDRNGKQWDAEPYALAGDGSANPDRMTLLIFKATGEDDRFVVLPLSSLVGAHRRPWPSTDPRYKG